MLWKQMWNCTAPMIVAIIRGILLLENNIDHPEINQTKY